VSARKGVILIAGLVVLSALPFIQVMALPMILQGYLKTSFGPSADDFSLHPVASFEKPGSRAQLALYEVAQPKTVP